MAGAIIDGILTTSILKASQLSLYDPSEEKCSFFASKGVCIAKSNIELAAKDDVLVIAVKPQVIDAVLNELKGNIKSKCIVSIAAGISTEHIRSVIGEDIPVVRVLPNTPMLVLEGMTIIAEASNVPEDVFEFIMNIFKAAGDVMVLPEDKINEAIPLSSSSPAFFFRMLDSMAQTGVKSGIEYKDALRLAAVAMLGSARYVIESGKMPEELIKQVSSPGGTTVAALSAFDDFSYETFMQEVSDRCIRRAYELGNSD